MENGALCFAASVKGKETPLNVKLPPEIVAWVTVTLEFPGFVKLPLNVWLLPTFTLPKAKLVGDTVSCPPATAVAFKLIEAEAFCAVLETVTIAVSVPALEGV
jgi:hypothetical protein